MAAVNLEILLLACCDQKTIRQHLDNGTAIKIGKTLPLWLSQAGLISCMLSELLL